jgi:hypothetical protein
MLDLYNKKYDRQILKDNIYAVKLIDILKTQTIDVTFAARYILNKKYQIHPDDDMTPPIVLYYQPHITYQELQNQLVNYDSGDDSTDDFETLADKVATV